MFLRIEDFCLHESYMTPEPLLVFSGTSYILPMYISYKSRFYYNAFSFLLLSFTTITFHGTRNEIVFLMDCAAILNLLACTIHNSYLTRHNWRIQIVLLLSIIYCLTSYFVGMKYNIMSFDPDWNTKMIFHSAMHLSTSYSAFLLTEERRMRIKMPVIYAEHIDADDIENKLN